MAGLVLDAVAAGRRTERADGGGSAEAGFADSASTPMSTVQDRIWFMHELAGSNLYTVPTFLELDGPLDVDALGRALTVLLARHSILRTLYRASAGLPRPVSLPPEPVVLMTVPSTEEDAVVTAAQSRVFRLADEIPVDFRLVARSSGQHLLVAAFHHIAVDSISLDLLFTELGVRYGEALRGTGPVDPLLEPAPRYSDHARAERDELATPVMQRRLRARAATVGAALADGGAALLARSGPAGPGDNPTARASRARPAVPAYTGDSVRTALPERVVTMIADLAARHRVTQAAVLVAPLAQLLASHGHTSTVLLGTPASGRTRSESLQTVGCFINVVPLIIRLDGARTVAELLARTQEALLDGLDHQDLPYEELVRALPCRRRTDPPPVTVLYSYEGGRPTYTFPGLSRAELTVARPSGTAKYDLSLYLRARGRRLEAEVEYDDERYDRSAASAILADYQRLLTGLGAASADGTGCR